MTTPYAVLWSIICAILNEGLAKSSLWVAPAYVSISTPTTSLLERASASSLMVSMFVLRYT